MGWNGFIIPETTVLYPIFIRAKLRHTLFFFRTAAQHSYKLLVKVNCDSFLNLDGFQTSQPVPKPTNARPVCKLFFCLQAFTKWHCFGVLHFFTVHVPLSLAQIFWHFFANFCSFPFHPTNQIQEFFRVLIFAPIRSSPTLETQSTPPPLGLTWFTNVDGIVLLVTAAFLSTFLYKLLAYPHWYNCLKDTL